MPTTQNELTLQFLINEVIKQAPKKNKLKITLFCLIIHYRAG